MSSRSKSAAAKPTEDTFIYDTLAPLTLEGGGGIIPHPISATVVGQLIESLTKVLLATRQKTLTSYYLGRCMNCAHPHVNGVCRSHCPCHEALALLDRLGLKPDMANR